MASKRPSRSRSAAPRPPERPIPGPQAFANAADAAHVQSQAATLLLIGSHLRGDADAVKARGALAPARPAVEALPSEDLAALGCPWLAPGPVRFRRQELQAAAGVRFAGPAAAPPPRDLRAASRRLPAVASAFYRDPNPETAATLLEVCLRHPHELVRVAAAASYVEVAVDPAPAIRILQRGARGRASLIRDVAATALGHVEPASAALARLLVPGRRPSRRPRSQTSTIVHGTWARGSEWWQPPSGDFWKFLHDTVDPDLYADGDRFEWTGGYSDAARGIAGPELHDWVQDEGLDGLDLFTHSHGGSVAMLATQAGTRVGRLVLLSCPVHWPKYMPDFARVTRVISIRVHLDLVILVDRGGQRFLDSRIEENVLPIWFDHFATHEPDTWVRHNVAALL
jgi:hypothetical protein